jgi:hypothetical protein
MIIFFKYLDIGVTFTKRRECSIGQKAQKISTSVHCNNNNNKNQGRYNTKYYTRKVKFGGLIPGHLTVKRKGKDAIGNN